MDFTVREHAETESELTQLNETELENEEGTYGIINTRTLQVNFTFPNIESLYQDLQLLYGIGQTTAANLQQQGYHSIRDLLAHPRWQKSALDLIKAIEIKDLIRLARYGASDLQLLSFFLPEAVKFIDIETVGLYYIHPVFLVGILQFTNGEGSITQFLARDFSEEKAILLETIKILNQSEMVISYNGRSFDLPYLKGRMKYHHLEDNFAPLHFDLLRQARRDYKQFLPNCRLLTIEKCLLNQERTDDIPGTEIANYYYSYLDNHDPGYIKPIIDHNARDLLSMAKFLGLITDRCRREGDC